MNLRPGRDPSKDLLDFGWVLLCVLALLSAGSVCHWLGSWYDQDPGGCEVTRGSQPPDAPEHLAETP